MDKNVNTTQPTPATLTSPNSVSSSIISLASPIFERELQAESTLSTGFETTITTIQTASTNTTTTTTSSTRVLIRNKKSLKKKKLKSKAKNLFLLNTVGLASIGLLFTLVVGILNVQKCNISTFNVPIYLIFFSVLCLTRILLYFMCPFNCNLAKKQQIESAGANINNNDTSINTTQESCCCCLCCVCCLFDKKQPQSYYQSTSIQTSSSFLSYLSLKLSSGANTNASSTNKSTSVIFKPYKILDIRSARYCLSYFIQRILDIIIVCWFLYGNFLVFQVKTQSTNDNKLNNSFNVTLTTSSNTHQFDITQQLINCDFCFNVALYKVIFIYALFACGFLLIVCYSSGKVLYDLVGRLNESSTKR